jgi:copper(I)-binding protein
MKDLSHIILSLTLVLSSSLSFAKELSISAPYVREVPPGLMTSASFLTISNNTDHDISLLKVSSDVAKHVELHEHTHKNGMMEMRQVDEIKIPAHGETVLKPGGYHIMLIGLTRKIKAGDLVDLTLEFNNDKQQTIKAEVKKIMQGMKK